MVETYVSNVGITFKRYKKIKEFLLLLSSYHPKNVEEYVWNIVFCLSVFLACGIAPWGGLGVVVRKVTKAVPKFWKSSKKISNIDVEGVKL